MNEILVSASWWTCHVQLSDMKEAYNGKNRRKNARKEFTFTLMKGEAIWVLGFLKIVKTMDYLHLHCAVAPAH